MIIKRLFRFNDDLYNYSFPFAGIIISILVMHLCGLREEIFNPKTEIAKEALTLFTIPVILACCLRFYCSVVELYCTYENRATRKRKEKRMNSSLGTLYSVDRIVEMMQNNDIIEFEICINNKVFNMGASSDCKNNNSNFFDKSYYFENEIYDDIEPVIDILRQQAENNMINVLSIDGVKMKNKGKKL